MPGLDSSDIPSLSVALREGSAGQRGRRAGSGEGSYCWSGAEGLSLQEEPAGSGVPLPICRVGVGEQELNTGGGDEVETGEATGNSGVPVSLL